MFHNTSIPESTSVKSTARAVLITVQQSKYFVLLGSRSGMKIENAKKNFLFTPVFPRLRWIVGIRMQLPRKLQAVKMEQRLLNVDPCSPEGESTSNKSDATQRSLRFCFGFLAATAALYVMMVFYIFPGKATFFSSDFEIIANMYRKN